MRIGFQKLVLLAILVAHTITDANAGLTHTCFFTSVVSNTGFGTADPSVPWFPAGTTVNVYYSTKTSGFDYRPWVAVGTTEAQFQQVVMKAVATWNEQSGARLRLRYMGPWPNDIVVCDQSLGQQCGIVIQGDQVSCPLTDTAESHIGLDLNTHKFKQGAIVFYYKNFGNDPFHCHAIPWLPTTGGYQTDVVRTLIHELGHSAFAMGHPTDTNPASDCTIVDPSGNNLMSVMNLQQFYDGRNLKAWDKEVAQRRYGTRASTAQFWKSIFTPSVGTWSPGRVVGSTSIHPLYRAGSVSQDNNMRVVGWTDGGTTVNTLGGGTGDASQYHAGLPSIVGLVSASSITGMMAIASQPQSVASPITLYAYKAIRTSTDGYQVDQALICWITSSFLGATWNLGNACAAASVGTSVHGLTAAYSEGASSFVVPWVDTTLGRWTISILTIPASGAAAVTTTLDVTSPTQPGIACLPSSTTCLVTYAADDIDGSLGWFTISVDATTKVASRTSTPLTSLTTVDDIPSIAYDRDDSTYRLARAEKSSAIYSYKKSVSGGSWTGTGDIYNNSGGTTQISGAAMAGRYTTSFGTSQLFGWFEIYF